MSIVIDSGVEKSLFVTDAVTDDGSDQGAATD